MSTIFIWPVKNGCVNAEISTLASGYSFPSVHVVVSSVSIVDRVRIVSPDDVSWKTT